MPPAHPVRTIDMRHATLWVYRHTAVLVHTAVRLYYTLYTAKVLYRLS